MVGTVVSASGPFSWPYIPEFWQHYERWINGQGGIDGHPLKILVKDDESNPATARKVVSELIQQDNVQAIVGDHSLNTVVWGEYIGEKKIPCVGCSFFSTEEISNPDFYPAGQNEVAQFYAATEQAKALGAKKIATYYCAEAPECAGVPAAIKKSAEIIGGIEMVAGVKVSASEPSYVPACLAAKNAGAEALYMGVNSTVSEKVVSTCQQQGYEPTTFVATNTIPFNSENPEWNGAIEIVPNGPINAETQYGAELGEVLGSIGEDGHLTNDISTPFAGMQMFRVVAEEERLKPGFTAAELTAGLDKVRNQTLNGGAGPISYVAGKPTLLTCYFADEINNGEWTITHGQKPVCAPVSAVVEVLGALG